MNMNMNININTKLQHKKKQKGTREVETRLKWRIMFIFSSSLPTGTWVPSR